MPIQNSFSGIGVGMKPASGEVFWVPARSELPARRKSELTPELEQEILDQALERVGEQLKTLQLAASGESAEIFHVLEALLRDSELLAEASSEIAQGWDAGSAMAIAVDQFAKLLSESQVGRERAADLKSLSRMVQAELHGLSLSLDIPKTGQLVLVSEDFSPAETAQFTEAVVAVVTLGGGPTSHTAIICRSKGIATLVCCPEAASLKNGERVLVDPALDRVVVGQAVFGKAESPNFNSRQAKPIIPVRANIETAEDARLAGKTAAVGVGLLRTELMYLSQQIQPSISSQAQSYAEILISAPQGPITVRTMDPSGDKPVPFLSLSKSTALGYQLLSEHRDFVTGQLRALELARAQSKREVAVMAPMIATVEQARDFVALARDCGEYRVGIMVETPELAKQVSELVELVDFISIGTNDLSRFLFQVDRRDPNAAQSLSHWQPRLIKVLEQLAQTLRQSAIPTSVCGESASDPAFAVVLAGLGFDSVSVAKSQIDLISQALRSVSLGQAETVAAEVALADSAEQAKSVALDRLASMWS